MRRPKTVAMSVEPRRNEVWYAQLPGKSTISEVFIKDVTDRTILIRVNDDEGVLSKFGIIGEPKFLRYDRSKVKFLEKFV